MGASIFDKIAAKLELLRLEKRYTKQRNRRSTFVSNAIYVDGEYVYQSPNITGSSSESSTPTMDALHGEQNVRTPATTRSISSGSTSTSNNPYFRQQRFAETDYDERFAVRGAEITKSNTSSSRDYFTRPAGGSDNALPSTSLPLAERKKLHRFSSMPRFGGSNLDKSLPPIQERRKSFRSDWA